MVQTARPTPADDHYETLGVAPDASPDEIGRAYRRRAKELHPDRAGPSGRADAARFHRLAAAYDVLRDPAARAAYDARRRATAGPARSVARPPSPRRAAFTFTPRWARVAVWGGGTLALLGVAIAVLTAVLALDSAAFRRDSEPATATVVAGADGNDVVFTTAGGEAVRVPEPERETPGVAGSTLRIRYDPADPTRVRADESTTARDVTLGIVAAKLLVGGPVFLVLGVRRLRALRRDRVRGPAASRRPAATAARGS